MHLTKHHGLGNDFLVLLDPAGEQPLTPDLVVRLCARRTGIGADGVMRATRPGAGSDQLHAVMELYNADGSRAEMSGNGIRCLAQALLLGGWAHGPDVTIATDAGIRMVSQHDRIDSFTHVLTVDMGAARLDGDASEWTGGSLRQAAWVDMGNPHLVIEVDGQGALGAIDLATVGEKVNAAVPGGVNVHLAAATGSTALVLRTYERGVGLTDACGTGACAAAFVAQQWGLVGEQVRVHMPGGTAEVQLGATIRLTGPAVAVAAIDYLVPGRR